MQLKERDSNGERGSAGHKPNTLYSVLCKPVCIRAKYDQIVEVYRQEVNLLYTNIVILPISAYSEKS